MCVVRSCMAEGHKELRGAYTVMKSVGQPLYTDKKMYCVQPFNIQRESCTKWSEFSICSY